MALAKILNIKSLFVLFFYQFTPGFGLVTVAIPSIIIARLSGLANGGNAV